MTDELHDITGYPGYAITRDGRVWSNPKASYPGGFLSPKKDKYGYIQVGLCRAGKRNMRQVHRLVLEAFVGPCPEGMEACHNNGNPSDNRVDNLRWDTRSENRKDALRHGTACCNAGETHGQTKLTVRDVRMIIYMSRTGEFTQQEIANVYGISRSAVGLIALKKNWKCVWQGNR